MTEPRTAIEPESARPCSDTLSVLVITADEQYADKLETAVDTGFTVRTTSSITAGGTALDDVDCLVVDYGLAGQRDADLLDLLERVRRRAPDLPVLLVTARPAASTAIDAAHAHRRVDWLELDDPDAGLERAESRITALVERQRLEALSRRSLASVELASDAIAIVAPDGEIEFANRSFAMQFGYDPDDLPGTSWQTLFTDDSVERLETTAIPTVDDGWRWTGSCTGRRQSGATFTVKLRLGGPDDGGLVFVVETPVDGDDPEKSQ
ncbi:PAS domain-containing protein [Natronorubrum sp. JWXQ-INN-674]|uniref:PAS domain-containing protein n=1 Tax=Natronorubrum halalkaliphilum TaxID=2691917 RepID=A0A6B0VN32_9EURY|nr:PAS domain S-box protein [Natronorubrum halalkaliphilum]MXV62954.1 PAS domain-containing protein [Natronorubrum halalkaliphilum]